MPPSSVKDVPVGVVTGAHGVKGEIRMKPFGDATSVAAMASDLWEEVAIEGVAYAIKRAKAHRSLVLLKLIGLTTRGAAEALRGKEVMVNREDLPEPDEGEYYQADLIGLSVVTVSGVLLGCVTGVIETGANDVIEIEGERGELLLPVIESVIKKVDMEGRRVTVAPPEGLDFVLKGGSKAGSKGGGGKEDDGRR